MVLRALAMPLLLLGIATALSPAVLGEALTSIAFALFVLRSMQILCEPEGVGPVHFNWPEQVTADIFRELHWLIRWWLPLGLAAFLIVRTILLPSSEAVLARYAMIVLILMPLVLLVHAVLLRWVTVTRRRLRMTELIEARAESGSAEDNFLDEQVTNLGDLSEESSQQINVGVAAAAITMLFYIWSPLLPAFEAFSDITLWTSTTMVEGQAVESRISLVMLLVVGFLASLTVFGARELPALIDLVLRS